MRKINQTTQPGSKSKQEINDRDEDKDTDSESESDSDIELGSNNNSTFIKSSTKLDKQNISLQQPIKQESPDIFVVIDLSVN